MTKKLPFDLLIGYTPRVHQPTRATNILTLEQQLRSIKEAREAAQEAQRKAQESWIKLRPQYKPFTAGDRVWLEGTNLNLPANVTPKLSPRRYGPFKVIEAISNAAFKIELPSHWKIHNIFHASLLTPYRETEAHGPNWIEPPPDIIEGEPEWEVEQVLQSRRFGRTKKKQYLVCWKGYSPLHDSWVDEQDINATDLVSDFYASHPTAIRSCINTPGNPNEKSSACPALSAPTLITQPDARTISFACLLGIPLSTPSHTASKSSSLPLGSQRHSNVPSILPMPTPSSTHTTAKNSTVPTTARCPSTQTFPAQDSPRLPSSPLALKMASYLSGCTP